MARLSGTISFTANGIRYDAVGNFTYGLGTEEREALVGADRVHGYKGMPRVPFIEGEIRDRPDLNVADFFEISDATVTLRLGNGKSIVLREAWYAGEGTGQTEDANLSVRFEGLSAKEETVL